MSNRFDLRRARLAGIALAATLAFAAVPVAAQASAVNLGTVSPFVVLGGSTVTNEGTSVLNGDLGLSPGTSLTGFNEAVVNGVTHENDAVAAQGQSDLTTAYNVAAGQPVPPSNDLTGIDLGGLKLTAGAYGFSTSAQLTGQLTLDAQGDPNAQFVFVIGSTLTTASASSVVLVNGASPCNVYWKVGSSATLGSTTAFAGNLMSLTSISANNGVNVVGRLLARNGAVTLINDVLSAPNCATGSTPTPTPTTPGTVPTTPAPPRPPPPRAEAAGRRTARASRAASPASATAPRPSAAAGPPPPAPGPRSTGAKSRASSSPTTANGSRIRRRRRRTCRRRPAPTWWWPT